MIALFPGSFDPFTFGHLDVAERAAAVADRLIIGVGINPAKRGLIAPEDRVDLVREATAYLPGVEVTLLAGATMDEAWVQPSSSRAFAARRTRILKRRRPPSTLKSEVSTRGGFPRDPGLGMYRRAPCANFSASKKMCHGMSHQRLCAI